MAESVRVVENCYSSGIFNFEFAEGTVTTRASESPVRKSGAILFKAGNPVLELGRPTLEALTMLVRILIACVLAAVTVVVHVVGLSALLRRVMRPDILRPMQLWPMTWLLIRMTWMLILIHGAEIIVWGAFYFLQGCVSDAESALYFSGATYTTVGYGDLVLPKPWRMFAPIEALTGILMCGLSTGFFVAVLSKVLGVVVEKEPR